jgi:hypothetical protein
MSLDLEKPAQRFNLNPLALAAAGLFLIVGIASGFCPLLADIPQWPGYLASTAPARLPFTIVAMFCILTVPVVCLAFAFLLSTNFIKVKLNWLILAYFVVFAILRPILLGISYYFENISLTYVKDYKLFYTGMDWLDQIAIVLFVIASVLGFLATLRPIQRMLSSRSRSTFGVQSESNLASQSPVSTESPLSNLPIFALVGAFVVPIAGIILGHISISQMNKGMISNQNRGLAMAGLILGYVFIALSILLGVLIAVALIASRSSYYY